jgi:hypothetical protein
MNKKNVLLKLLNNKIVKISGIGDLKRYTPAYFKLDKDLKILSYNKEINLSENFERRNDLTLDRLLNHIMQMQKEGFKLDFFDILLLK